MRSLEERVQEVTEFQYLESEAGRDGSVTEDKEESGKGKQFFFQPFQGLEWKNLSL